MAKRSSSERRRAASRGETVSDEVLNATNAGEQSEQDAPAPASVTRELPPIEQSADAGASASITAPEPTAAADASPAAWMLDSEPDMDEGATREAAAVHAPEASLPHDDPDATIVRPGPLHPHEAATVSEPAGPGDITPAPRRYNTLAGAFSRPRPMPEQHQYEDQTPPPATTVPAEFSSFEASGIADEVDPDVEWSMADQPTIHLSPEELKALRPASFLDTSDVPSWPPRPQSPRAPDAQPRPGRDVTPAYPPAQPDQPRWKQGLPPRPQPPFPLDGLGRALTPGERLAAPDGRLAPTPEPDEPPVDYRMERFQELRRHRMAHDQGDAATDDVTPVADAVRQWWNDLRPGVGTALQFQREARESGVHPLPAYAAPTPTSRLGDAFGRLAASAREVTQRGKDAAGPTLKRWHDQMEQAAQGLIQRFEGDAARQQAPLLGPGRVAVFFRRGVTVGQAQRLLAASSARPMRLIPRKHGILAQVMPGREGEICERLRQHPYVDDVVYVDYDERGEPAPAGH